MKLKLYNNLTKIEYEFDELQDNLKSNQFYNFKIQLPSGITDGEYTYRLFDENDKEIALGLLQVGDFERQTIQHNNDKKGYITYNG